MTIPPDASPPRQPSEPRGRTLLLGGVERRALLAEGLEQRGFDVVLASCAPEALGLANDTDVALLDLDALDGAHDDPGGFRTVARFQETQVPVVVLAADLPVDQRAALLDQGADDLMAHPVEMSELSARLRALIRRSPRPTRRHETVRAGALTVDFTARTTTVAGDPVFLTPIEWGLLEELVRQPNAVLDHAQLTARVWGRAQPTDTRPLRVHIAHLRRKLAGAGTELIETDHGLGYRWRGPPPSR